MSFLNYLSKLGSNTDDTTGDTSYSLWDHLIHFIIKKYLQPHVYGFLAIGIGFIGLAGWLTSSWILATILPGMKPISPNSAFLFILLGTALALSEKSESDKRYEIIQKLLSLLSLYIAIGGIIDYISGYPANIDWFLLASSHVFQGIQQGRMSPVSALLFIISAIGMFFYRHNSKAGEYTGAGTFFGGVLILLGYWYGSPLFYGGAILPMALLTAIGFIILGTGLLVLIRPSWFPVPYMQEQSVRYLILTYFIPLILGIIILEGWVISLILHYTDDYLVLSIAAFTIVSGIIAVIIATSFSRIITARIDAANLKQKIAEEALTETLYRLDIAAEAAELGFWDWNFKTDELFWDERTYRLFQVPQNTPLKIQDWLDRVIPYYRPKDQEIINIRNKKEYHAEYRVKEPDGSIRTIEGHGKVILSESGDPERMVGMNWDITPKITLIETLNEKNTELEVAYEELMSQEEELKSQFREITNANREISNLHKFAEEIISQAGEGIIVLNEEGKISIWNDEMKDYSGISEREIIGTDILEFFQTITDFPLNMYIHDAFQGQKRTTPDTRFTFQRTKKKGWFIATIAPHLNASGQIIGTILTFRDITRRKTTERRLIQSETILRASQGMAKVGGWEWDLQTNMMFWTDETFEIHGIDRQDSPKGSQDFIDRSVSCYDESDRERVLDAFYRCIHEGESYDLEFPFTSLKGKRIWIRTRAEPVWENGTIIRVFGTIMDITDVKTYVSQLESERKQLHDILDHMPDGIYMVNKNYQITYTNPVMKEWFGDPDENCCYCYLHNRTSPCPWCPNEKVFTGETIQRKWNDEKHGRYYDLFDTSYIAPDGELYKLQFIHDITSLHLTEIKLAETNEYLTRLIRYANVPIMVWDKDNKIHEFNYALEVLSGYQRTDLLQKPYTSVFPDHMTDEILSLFSNGMKKGQLNQKEIPIKHQDGKIIPVIWNASHIRDQEGNLLAIIAQGRDVSRERVLEKKNTSAIEQIKRNLAELAIMNDGIRNPLMVISMLCELNCPDLYNEFEVHIKKIDKIVSQLDCRWMESESVLNFLQKHYKIEFDEEIKSS